MKTLCTIYTWSGDKDIINRNLPTFEKKGMDLNIVSPVDQPSHRGGMTAFKSQQFGEDLMKRIRAGMAHCLGCSYESYLFVEADTVCLRALPEMPEEYQDTFNCFRYFNTQPERFKAKNVTHFPWWLSRATLARVHKAMLGYAMDIEHGFADRTMPFILEREDIRIHHCWQLFYSANSITEESHWKDIEERKDTLVAVHGVKSQEQFDRIMGII